jgi:hypothetical protein
MRIDRFVSAFIVLMATVATGSAQQLPAPSRTVYRCEAAGKVTYSDAPCVGAKKVDVEPTRGLNRSTGAERLGSDVMRERQTELIADAVRPITGLDSQQFEVQRRRVQLPVAAKKECRALDQAIPRFERQETLTSSQELPAIQQQLFKLRKRYQQLHC